MKHVNMKHYGVLGMGLLSLPFAAMADSISPSTYSATLNVGQTSTITKTVTVNAGPATPTALDVFFLTDTTGSMTPSIAGVKSQFGTIVSNLSATYGSSLQTGTAQYKDTFDGLPTNGVLQLTQNLTANSALVQSAINGYSAFGGGDLPESGIFSLKTIADNASWRAGAAHFIVWTGDAPSHNKLFGIDAAAAIAALNAHNVHVIGISQPSGPGLDAASGGSQTGQLGDIANASAGQATAITTATGGSFFPTATAAQIEASITAGISTAFAHYSTVGLDISGVPAGTSVAVSGPVTGAFDRSVDRTFTFTASFTGVTPGVYSFPIYATVDGVRVATESDTITTPTTRVPEPVSLALFGIGLAALRMARRGKSA
ncbi:MAG: PEP-CTERM sorting domain-containing protein [Methylococcaceae bacterium]|nr:PEP-CTERM sorting domain-containing protein [Methylococcaceae bacterium]